MWWGALDSGLSVGVSGQAQRSRALYLRFAQSLDTGRPGKDVATREATLQLRLKLTALTTGAWLLSSPAANQQGFLGGGSSRCISMTTVPHSPPAPTSLQLEDFVVRSAPSSLPLFTSAESDSPGGLPAGHWRRKKEEL